jgi:hypothetical protein
MAMCKVSAFALPSAVVQGLPPCTNGKPLHRRNDAGLYRPCALRTPGCPGVLSTYFPQLKRGTLHNIMTHLALRKCSTCLPGHASALSFHSLSVRWKCFAYFLYRFPQRNLCHALTHITHAQLRKVGSNHPMSNAAGIVSAIPGARKTRSISAACSRGIIQPEGDADQLRKHD